MDLYHLLLIISKLSVFILPSFYEGIPNVVCEAWLVENLYLSVMFVIIALNGFLFNPHSVKDMAEKIIKFTKIIRH